MPRKNRSKPNIQLHEPSVYEDGFKPGCYGCAFAGRDFKCMTSDGKCLLSAPVRGEPARRQAEHSAQGEF